MSLPRVRAVPEDFVVEEVPLYRPSGSGPHTWCWVEKRLATTDEAAEALARAAGVGIREVGFAGRKDRRAVTRQWLSVPGLDPDSASRVDSDVLRVLRAVPHRHRLHLGDLLGNRFRLRIRDVSAEVGEVAAERWAGLVARGMPNRFGPQRFGRDGENSERGRRLLAGEPVGGPRRLFRLYLSALQSAVFNEVLRRRPVGLDEAVPGDLLLDPDTGALHPASVPADWAARLADFRLSPTGPLFGPKMRRPTREAGALEASALRDLEIPDPLPENVLRKHRISGERRPLRVQIREPELERTGDRLDLAFVLPAGSYASVLVDEILPAGYDEGS